MEKHTVVAVDIAKAVFDAAVSHEPGRVAETHRLSRKLFLPFFAQMPAATVVMEACGSAHFWARKLQELPVLQAKVALTEVGQGDGATGQGWLRFLVGPAKIELDRGVTTAGVAQVFGQRLHALKIGGIGGAFRRARLSWHGGRAAPALDMSSCEVEERSIWTESTASASILGHFPNGEKRRGLRLL